MPKRLSTGLALALIASFVAQPDQVQAAQVQASQVQADPLSPTGRWSANTRGVSATPPMGWSSWNAFGMEIDETKIIGVAEALVDTGLADLGYRYVNIDDGWWSQRRLGDGRIQIRTELFPSAAVGGEAVTSFRPLVDRIHGMGLKAGIYSDIGRNSCSQSFDRTSPNLPEGTIEEREIGLYGHVDTDVALFFADWGFDYIKVDACGVDDTGARARLTRGGDFRPIAPIVVRDSVNRSDIPTIRALYQSVGDALARHNPDGDYVFSLCLWGAANVRAWGKDVANLVRTSDDIKPNWGRMLHVFDSAANRPLYAGPGRWNDPDMLYVGQGDFDADHLVEARSHFSLWAIINAPLLIGYDLRDAPRPVLDVLGAGDLIAVNQDPGGHQAVEAYTSDDVQIFVKTLTGEDRKAVALFNRGDGPVDVTLIASHLKFAANAPITLRDLWSGETLAPFVNERTFKLGARETLVFEARGTRALPGGWYVSELPGRVNPAHDGVVQPQADPTIHRAINPYGEGTRSPGSRPIYAGWGGAAADRGPYGQALLVQAQHFDSGIGVLANSRLEVRNDREHVRFTAQVGVDDNTLNLDSEVVLQVFGDGRLLAESRPRRFGQPTVALDVDISGVGIVELVARQVGDPSRPVSVVWGDAALHHAAS